MQTIRVRLSQVSRAVRVVAALSSLLTAPTWASGSNRGLQASALAPAFWRTAYIPAWIQAPAYPLSAIDFGTVTHAIHFGICLEADGSLDSDCEELTDAAATAFVKAAHGRGRKALISVHGYGADSHSKWASATSGAARTRLVRDVASYMTSKGYDGVDIDWEPLYAADGPQFIAFIRELRARLNVVKPGSLLTAAVSSEPEFFSELHPLLNQLNIMSYDLAGPWEAPFTWHNAALRSGNVVIGPDWPVTSVDTKVDAFLSAGVPAEKIGVGLPFYGWSWCGGSGTATGGVTRPAQAYRGTATFKKVNFNQLLKPPYTQMLPKWDVIGEVPYLSMNKPRNQNDCFISYDDEHSIAVKVNYALDLKLGGVMIWHLGADYAPDALGIQQPLVDAISRVLPVSLR